MIYPFNTSQVGKTSCILNLQETLITEVQLLLAGLKSNSEIVENFQKLRTELH